MYNPWLMIIGANAQMGRRRKSGASAPPASMPSSNAINAWTTDMTVSAPDVTDWFDDVGTVNLSPAFSFPDSGTMAGLAAPNFVRANPDDMICPPGTAMAAIINIAEWHWWIVFQIGDTGPGSDGAQYYEVKAFCTEESGWFAIGVQDNGRLTAGVNAGGADTTINSAASGYDDSAVHVLHVWYDGTNLNLRVDNASTVSSALGGAIRDVDGAAIVFGVDWGFGLGIPGLMHQWTYGAMTAGEVTQAYAYLEDVYGVTVP